VSIEQSLVFADYYQITKSLLGCENIVNLSA